MLAAEIGLAAIAAGATIGKMSDEKEAEQANLSAINQQSKILNLQYQQKHMQNLDVIEKMLSKQAAQLSTRGVAFDSPSFNAIQRETINKGAKSESNLNTEQALTNQSLAIERKNAKTALHTQLFGDAASLGFSALSLYNATPTKGTLPQVEDL